MAMARAPLAPPPLSPSPSMPLEIAQQLQRVEILHQQLKAEAQRAQEFLAKLRRGELEAQSQAQSQLEQLHKDRAVEEGKHKSSDGKAADHAHNACTCSCPHNPTTSISSSQPTTSYNRNSFSTNHEWSTAPLPPIPTRVDEREVRDLEKRVRGLEGRVRGFEGLPPDRELALLEVERLRRELEGLARRREGLFEGLGCEEVRRLGGGNGGRSEAVSTKAKAKLVSGPLETTPRGGETTSSENSQGANGRTVARNGGKGTGGKGRRRG